MKIALIGDYPFEIDKIRGGVQAVFVNLAEGLGRISNLDVHVITPKLEISQPKQIRQGVVTVWYIPGQKHFKAKSLYLLDRIKIHQLLNKLEPDVVHAQGMDESAYIALTARFPVVVSVHGVLGRDALAEGTGLRQRWKRFNASIPERMFIRDARHVIASSPYIRRVFGNDLVNAQIYDVLNPIDESFFGLDNTPVDGRLLFAGRLTERKSVETILEAVNIAINVNPHITLHIVGPPSDPHYYAFLQTKVNELGLGTKVYFTGLIPQKALMQEYAESSIVLLSSKEETSPMAIQQAMAAGIPVVSTAAGGVPDLVRDGVTGYVVPVGDAAAMADRIGMLLADEERHQAFGKAAKRLAIEQFHIDVVAVRHYEVYKQVIASYSK